MTLLYDDTIFLKHETGRHPERAERIRDLSARLDEAGLRPLCERPEFQPVAPNRLARIHAPDYVTEVWSLAKSGGGDLDPDTVVSPASYDVALMAAGSACDATERVLRGEDTQALCLVRPPGHHAMLNHAMGFCLFNNVAIAARVATEDFELDRVLIVDWDIHHGNGTQAAFWDDPKVGFYSIHRWPFYPGTGAAEETGVAAGAGTILNMPVRFGISRREYLDRFRQGLEQLAEKIRPQLILLSAGFDAHRADPVGNLGLEAEDFGTMTEALLDVADTHAQGRIVGVLEGGYNPDALATCVECHLREMLRHQGKLPG